MTVYADNHKQLKADFPYYVAIEIKQDSTGYLLVNAYDSSEDELSNNTVASHGDVFIQQNTVIEEFLNNTLMDPDMHDELFQGWDVITLISPDIWGGYVDMFGSDSN